MKISSEDELYILGICDAFDAVENVLKDYPRAEDVADNLRNMAVCITIEEENEKEVLAEIVLGKNGLSLGEFNF